MRTASPNFKYLVSCIIVQKVSHTTLTPSLFTINYDLWVRWVLDFIMNQSHIGMPNLMLQ